MKRQREIKVVVSVRGGRPGMKHSKRGEFAAKHDFGAIACVHGRGGNRTSRVKSSGFRRRCGSTASGATSTAAVKRALQSLARQLR